MGFHFLKNIRTIYYNILVNFYLCLNFCLPLYDDVIITLQKQSLNALLEDNQTTFRQVKRKRFLNFVETLDQVDKIIIKDDGIEMIEFTETTDDELEDDDTSQEENDEENHVVQTQDNNDTSEEKKQAIIPEADVKEDIKKNQ